MYTAEKPAEVAREIPVTLSTGKRGRTVSLGPPLHLERKPITPGRNWGDVLFKNTTRFFALSLLLLVILMGWEIYRGSALSLQKFGWQFLSSNAWDPVQEDFGALPFILGTLYSSLVALIIALPLSLGVAVFLAELAPRWLEKIISFPVELLAGIPSVVYGLWGIFVLVPWLRSTVEPFLIKHVGILPLFKGAPYGFGMLPSALILAIMILPIVSSISRDVLKSIPRTQREAAYALGATRWETTKILLRNGKSGILGATILGLGRAIGETMAVTMLIGNTPSFSMSLLNPGYTLASVIANEFTEATSDLYISALTEIALVLFVITIVINVVARLLVWSVTRKYSTARV